MPIVQAADTSNANKLFATRCAALAVLVMTATSALTVTVILDHYPVASIQDIDITPSFLTNALWGAKLAIIEGEKVALDDIEPRILRPIWKDPRIHYIVNNASIGCPNIHPWRSLRTTQKS